LEVGRLRAEGVISHAAMARALVIEPASVHLGQAA
jgi:hypothetical protein